LTFGGSTSAAALDGELSTLVTEDLPDGAGLWLIVDIAQGSGVPMPAAHRTSHLLVEIRIVISSATIFVSAKLALAKGVGTVVVEDPGGAHGGRFIVVDPLHRTGVPMPLPKLIPGAVFRLWCWWLLGPEQRSRFFQWARILLCDRRAAYGLFVWFCVAPLTEITRIATIGGHAIYSAVRAMIIYPVSTPSILEALLDGTVGMRLLVRRFCIWWKGGICRWCKVRI
jgi:hypothetical protein